jgi:hypothetical protein
LGNYFFQGYDGGEYLNGARITAIVSNTPDNDDMPTKVEIYTCPDGSKTLTLAARWESTQYVLMKGVYDQTSASVANVVVDSSGNIMRNSSSAKYKTAIRALPADDKAKVLQLSGVRYKSQIDKDRDQKNKQDRVKMAQERLAIATESGSVRDITTAQEDLAKAQAWAAKPTKDTDYFGLIAEDVAPIIPELVVYDDDDQPDAIMYERLPVLILEAVKNIEERVQALEKKPK